MEIHFCWRCKAEVPFLNETEWAEIDSLISLQSNIIKNYRLEHGCTIKTASENAFKPATDKYFELTGFLETNHLVIFHHRLSLFGSKCNYCGHLLRTPKAKFCANCSQATVDT